VTNDIVKSESNAVFCCASWFYGNAPCSHQFLLLFTYVTSDNENGSTMHSMTERLYDYPSFEEIPGKVGCD
jgi:hypothetical protein